MADFAELVQSCRSIKTAFSKTFHGMPDSINFSKDGKQVLFLSGGSLYTDNITQDEVEKDSTMVDKHPVAMETDSELPIKTTGWKKLCASNPHRQLSRNEQLLRERMRATGTGITKYDYVVEGAGQGEELLVHGPQCTAFNKTTEDIVRSFPELLGAIDYKPCPGHPQLLACVFEHELWLLDSSHKHKLTSSREGNSQLSAGAPSFIIQEEFDRYTGYWWQPNTGQDGVHRILYEEIDESGLEVVHTFNPSNQMVEDYNYPRPGSWNARSELHLLEFTIGPQGEVSTVVKTLGYKLRECVGGEWEYLVRAGWTPDGRWVWLQVMDRLQNNLKLAVIRVDSFKSQHDGHTSLPVVIWEDSNPTWIYPDDSLTFIPQSCDPQPSSCDLQFIITSDQSGFRHLYKVAATIKSDNTVEKSVSQLTSGDWVVFGSKIWLDAERGEVYFEANLGSPLERHLCVASYVSDLPAVQELTSTGYYHSILALDTDHGLFVSSYSNWSTPPNVGVFAISHTPLSATPIHTLRESIPLPLGYVPPTTFQVLSASGEVLHGLVFPPIGLTPGSKYPTILYTYGGPQIQMVTSGLSRHLSRIQVWRYHGYAVVVVDNRGSANRGTKFEAHLKGKFGRIEVEDQVTGLSHAAERVVDYIDSSRVAITGWSYGGYLSLMALALRPDVFKVAIAGAPVTDWCWYDTGYTERYLGIPPNDSYTHSSVLHYVKQLPSEPHRLLIIHGLNDENVLFTHTSLLCDKLINWGCPYQLQLYNGERHGLRSHSAVLHCDATVLAFLKSHL